MVVRKDGWPRPKILPRLAAIGAAFAALLGGAYFLFIEQAAISTVDPSRTIRVLSYSSFLNSWGPGPEIIERFKRESGLDVAGGVEGGAGIDVIVHEVSDAGLLLKKLELFPADVVIGLDQLMLPEARKACAWKPLEGEPDFLPYDWGPMTFIYREGEIDPPKSLLDLLHERFRHAITLQDPRTSTPGLQFLYWVLDEMGVEAGFAFLEKLKPNLHSVSGSWSMAYGIFTKKEAKLAFSYSTSPVYHWMRENDMSYKPAIFATGHPAQVEYAGVPESCVNCEGGRRFAAFLLRPDVQKILMEKNFMMPIRKEVAAETLFAKLPQLTVREMRSLPALVRDREALLERWHQLGL